MAVNWQVRSVSDETVSVIKRKAKNRGLTIGQFLDWHFSQDCDANFDPRKGIKEYKISLPIEAMNRLKQKAAENGYGVAKYLENLDSLL
jgi:hypothetical protein